MSQYLISVIRTWVPVLVGSLLAKLVVIGVVIDDDSSTGLKNAITLLVIGLYYAAIRWLEQKFPRVGIMLGYIRQPVYVDPTKTLTQQINTVQANVATVAADPPATDYPGKNPYS